MRRGVSFTVSAEDRARLRAIVEDRNSAQKHVWRARIILASADGLGTMAIMAATGKSKTCVWRWQERFMEEGVDGLLRDKTRPPGRKPLSPARVATIVRLTQTPPMGEATHWTLRAMAKAAGVAASTVRTIWQAHGLAPHRWRQFKLSTDPPFVDKVRDIVGLYVEPPAHAAVLSIDRAWASTVHAFQGRTVDSVIAAIEAKHPNLTNQKMLFVEISRARDRAELVTDDRAGLKEQLEALTGERIAALEALGEDRAKGQEEARGREGAESPGGRGRAGAGEGSGCCYDRSRTVGREGPWFVRRGVGAAGCRRPGPEAKSRRLSRSMRHWRA